MIVLHLCVNDGNGNVTDSCEFVEIEAFGLSLMQFECELKFSELPDDKIQIGAHVYEYKVRGTMVGNVFWNAYHVAAVEMVRLVKHLGEIGDQLTLVEASTLLYDKWEAMEPITIDDFSAVLKS